MSETSVDPASALGDVVEGTTAVTAEDEWVHDAHDKLWEARLRWTKVRGMRDHFIHKGWWSGCLLGTIMWMVFFESLLVACVGFGWWDFSEYSWLVPTLMIQFLAQIVGLGLLVVKSLFKEMT